MSTPIHQSTNRELGFHFTFTAGNQTCCWPDFPSEAFNGNRCSLSHTGKGDFWGLLGLGSLDTVHPMRAQGPRTLLGLGKGRAALPPVTNPGRGREHGQNIHGFLWCLVSSPKSILESVTVSVKNSSGGSEKNVAWVTLMLGLSQVHVISHTLLWEGGSAESHSQLLTVSYWLSPPQQGTEGGTRNRVKGNLFFWVFFELTFSF